MEELNELMRQPEGMAMVLAFLALLVTVMATLYGALERAALVRRLSALESEAGEDDAREEILSSLTGEDILKAETDREVESPDDTLPPGTRFV